MVPLNGGSLMDSSEIAAWAEVVSAAGVIVSLLYLAAQMRVGNRIAKAAAQEALTDSFRNLTQPLATDAEFYRLTHQGMESFEELEGDDRGRFVHLAYQFGKFCESAHYQWVQGLIDEDYWEAWRTLMAHYFHAPGWKQYWALRYDMYSSTFRAFVEELPVPDNRSTAGTLGLSRRAHPETLP